MEKKTVIEQKINKHTKELEASIKIIEPKLIEAFVRIYGEEHRSKITYTILNMNYIFFISEKSCKILNSPKSGVRKKDLNTLQSYLRYLNKQDKCFNTVAPKDQERFIIKNYLSRYPFKVEDYSDFADALASDCPCCSIYFRESPKSISTEFYICLPIFTIDLKTIIHELNHALNINVVGYTAEKILMEYLFKTEVSEELVNDFIAGLVFEKYLELGGIIPKPLKRFEISSGYEFKDYIVAYLFENLEPLLLESRISGNYNLFYKLVGIDRTRSLERIMEELYSKKYFDEYLYKELIYLIDEIYESVINSDPLSIEEQLKYFEEQGLKLRRLKKVV